MRDDHGQAPNPIFTARANREMAMETLLGVLQGIVANCQLCNSEAHFLDFWLRDNPEVTDDGDVIDLIECVSDLAAHGYATDVELEDLKQLIQDIIEYRCDAHQPTPDRTVMRLLGISQGITADGCLHRYEVLFLYKWLGRYPEIHEDWPASEIVTHVRAIVADGEITPMECDGLYQTLVALVGGHYSETGTACGLSTRLCINDRAHVDFDGKTFCFSGRFQFGQRNDLKKAIADRGGQVSPRISGLLDYLIVGTISSRDWKFMSHGRKIQQAMELKASGHRIEIVSEDCWVRHL